ncbi:MAG TPA: hypothetical protein VGM98_06280, partial [Schlesneria sp.]
WEMYDCPGYAANLAHLPTIAYSGEIDSQKQAADIMAAAFEREGMKLPHIIGPKTAHSIHPESKKEIEAKLAEWAVKGIDHSPTSLQFVTFTLSYNRMHWLTVDELKEHWEEARVTAKPVNDELAVQTKNVSALTLQPPKGSPQKIRLDGGTLLELPTDGSQSSFVLTDKGWQVGDITAHHRQSLGKNSPERLEFGIVATTRHDQALIDQAMKLPNDINELSSKSGDEKVIVAAWHELADKKDPEREFPNVGFRSVPRRDSDGKEVQVPQLLIKHDPPSRAVTGAYLTNARATTDNNGAGAVAFTFNARGATLFHNLTSDNLPNKTDGAARQLAILLDGKIQSAPVIRDVISSTVQITGNFKKADIDSLVTVLNAGQRKGLHKKHGLQGPIDDAFLDSFVFVKPSGQCRSDAVDKWVHSEFDHAVTQWRQQMRGDAIVKSDSEITEQDIASSNLVLWGDALSNKVLAEIADRLPIRWTEKSVVAGDRSFDGANHALIAIYPNPLNPEKYIVLNSSFTYREYDYLNNARQTPKLPDWVIVDVRTPGNSRFPGKIVAADFFDEGWQLKPAKTR